MGECLSATGACKLYHHQDSLLGSCLMTDHSPATHHHHHSVTDLGRRLDCFKSYQNDLSVVFKLGEETFIYGWNTKLQYQDSDGSDVVSLEDDFFMRYDNTFSSTPWGSKI